MQGALQVLIPQIGKDALLAGLSVQFWQVTFRPSFPHTIATGSGGNDFGFRLFFAVDRSFPRLHLAAT
jgi:hypothetical protein